jgi:hypothetical protein
VLSATGDILDSNKKSDIGTQLDSRWWDRLKDEESGFIQEQLDFGNQKLSLTALHHAAMGRWVVIVSRPRSTGTLTMLYFGLILIIGLILWLLTAGLIWGTLSQKIALSNKALPNCLSIHAAWIEGQSLSMLKGFVPVSHLETWFSKESASKVGIAKVELFPAHNSELSDLILLTIQPIQFEGSTCH